MPFEQVQWKLEADPPHWEQSPGRQAQSAAVVHCALLRGMQVFNAPSFHIEGLDVTQTRSLLGQPTKPIPPHADSHPWIELPEASRQ